MEITGLVQSSGILSCNEYVTQTMENHRFVSVVWLVLWFLHKVSKSFMIKDSCDRSGLNTINTINFERYISDVVKFLYGEN